MKTKTTYKGTLNGVSGLWCGFKPEGLEVEEEISVLYADEGKILEHKKTHEQTTSVIDGLEKDYIEVDLEEETD